MEAVQLVKNKLKVSCFT